MCLNKFIQVFLFHFKESVNSKFSIIMNIIISLLILGFFGISHWFSHQESDAPVIVVINHSTSFSVNADLLNEMGTDLDFSVKPYSELEQALIGLKAGNVDTIFVIHGNEIPSVQSISFKTNHRRAEAIIIQKVQSQYITFVMEQENIVPEMVSGLLQPIEVSHEFIHSREEFMTNLAVAYIGGMVLMVVVTGYGNMIGMSVVNEKESCVMEIMISKVNPAAMIYAKILAVLGGIMVSVLAGVAGFMLATAFGWANVAFLGIVDFGLVQTSILLIGLVYLILGYLVFAMIFATAGALCSKQEDYQSIGAPLQFIAIVPFFIMMFVNMDSLIVEILTYVPIFSPFITFARLVEGYVGYLEVEITMSLMILTIVLGGKFITKLYVGGVMHYSDKASFKDIKKLLKG